MMKKLIGVVLGASLIVTSVFCINASLDSNSQAVAEQDGSKVELISSEDIFNSMQGGNHVEADYNDGSISLNEMTEKADAIVVGKVLKQEQFSPVSVVSTVKVQKTLKGIVSDEIIIYQHGIIGDESLLNVKDKYILHLGMQKEGSKDEFFIKGGFQGKFKDDNGKLICSDPIMKKEIEKLVQQKSKNKKSKQDVSEFELLIESINEQK